MAFRECTKFDVRTGWESGYSIELLDEGRVCYSEYSFEGYAHGQPDDEPENERSCPDPDYEPESPYSTFLKYLDIVAKKYPEVYFAVYEHIQDRTEYAYRCLAGYCKYQNNSFISQFQSKFQIIE